MKSGEEAGAFEKQEILWEKLKRVGKRGGHTTPIAASFFTTNYDSHFLLASHNTTFLQEKSSPFPTTSISSRRLGAALWELHHYEAPLANMHRGGGGPHREKGGGRQQLEPPPEMPRSSILRGHLDAFLMENHRSIKKINNAARSLSPSSYGSSMEIAPYKPAATPSSSIELRQKNGDASYSLKTSSELIKVLNRIWILEEQHVSNTSLVKSLKKELYHARSQIKQLVSEQQADRNGMDELMKRITEDKLVRKNKEHDRINAVKDELEDERKLRKRSESLHRKLAHELFEFKMSLASVSKEMEKERKSKNLLEDLCDEFALGIRGYENELGRNTDKDRLILRMSESWLDERMGATGEKKSTLDKLSSEIQSFLLKRKGEEKINVNHLLNEPTSIPLNLGASAPRDEDDDEDDSESNDSNCFELEKKRESDVEKNHCMETVKRKLVKEKIESSERTSAFSPSHLQLKFDEQMAQAEENVSRKSYEKREAKEENIENVIRNHFLSSESRKVGRDNDDDVSSFKWRSYPSPVRQWTEKLPPHDHDETSLKLPPELKENTLKAKLFEARTNGQRSRSRVKASIFPSRKG